MKAMIVNRIGDFGISLAIALLFFSFSTLDFSIIFNVIPLITKEDFIFFGFGINKITLILNNHENL